MDQKLTIGAFILGCTIVTAIILAYNHIEKLEKLIRDQQETIEIQQHAIGMKNIETNMYKNMLGIK